MLNPRSERVVLSAIADAALLAAVGAGSAQQNPDYKPWLDSDRLLLLGDYWPGLGTPLQQLPAQALANPQECRNPVAPDLIDCEFFDEHGLAYLIDSSGVIRIEARTADGIDPSRPLSPGLALGATRAQVATQIRTLPAAAPIEQLL